MVRVTTNRFCKIIKQNLIQKMQKWIKITLKKNDKLAFLLSISFYLEIREQSKLKLEHNVGKVTGMFD